jgi:hypothetical protein
MRQPGKQDLVEVGEHCLERLRLVRRRGWERSPDLARLDLREDGQLADAVEVVRDPVESRSPVLSEAHFASLLTSRQDRVLRTRSFVSHARRA